ncbi:MAG: aspartate aminotransferase family protein [Pseudomonadota bacterium]
MDRHLRQGFDDFREFVNPAVAARAALSGEPYLLTRVSEGRLVDAQGKPHIDMISGWGTQAFGHRPAAIESALIEFLKGDQPSFYPSSVSPHAGHLARLLSKRTGLDAAFFASGGTEAVEAAMKLARAATGRPRIACLAGAYHGCTLGSVAMMAPGPYRDPFGPHLPEIDALPFDDEEALRQALADPKLAAIVVEPMQIEAGVRTLSPSYLRLLCDGTQAAGVLLVADEIQTGLGRTGLFLRSETWPRRPDVVTLGKALGGGVMPLSAMLTRREVFDRVYGSLGMAEAHASTFSGNALACVAGLAALSHLDDALLVQVQRKAKVLREALQAWVAPSPLVADVRGEGLLLGIELRTLDHPCYQFECLGLPELGSQPAIGFLAVHRLYKAGFITQVCGHAWQVLRLQPPYTTPEADLVSFAQALGQALDHLEALQ